MFGRSTEHCRQIWPFGVPDYTLVYETRETGSIPVGATMFNACKNTKKQGEIGIAEAIAFFTRSGFNVLLPITDSNDYDFVIELNSVFSRVQVKTSSYKRNDNYVINLSVKGGNRSFNTVKKFDYTKVDYVFILVEDGVKYCIPSKDISGLTGSITMCRKYDTYKVV